MTLMYATAKGFSASVLASTASVSRVDDSSPDRISREVSEMGRRQSSSGFNGASRGRPVTDCGSLAQAPGGQTIRRGSLQLSPFYFGPESLLQSQSSKTRGPPAPEESGGSAATTSPRSSCAPAMTSAANAGLWATGGACGDTFC